MLLSVPLGLFKYKPIYSKSNNLLNEEMFVYFTWNYFNSTNRKKSTLYKTHYWQWQSPRWPPCQLAVEGAGYPSVVRLGTAAPPSLRVVSAWQGWAQERAGPARWRKSPGEEKGKPRVFHQLSALWSPYRTAGHLQTQKAGLKTRKKKKLCTFFCLIKKYLSLSCTNICQWWKTPAFYHCLSELFRII